MSLKPNSNKSLSEILNEGFSNFSSFLNCIKIGKIQSFNTEQQTASVQIMHKERNPYNLIENEILDYPLLEEVPIVIMGGGGTYISHPIAQGDYCLLLFCDNDIDAWWISGEARPSDYPRKHNLSDAIGIVGLNPLISLIQNYSNLLEIHYSDTSKVVMGNESIEVTNPQVNMSGNLAVTSDITAAKATADLHSTTGASGSFSNAAGQTLTIVDGIITAIS